MVTCFCTSPLFLEGTVWCLEGQTSSSSQTPNNSAVTQLLFNFRPGTITYFTGNCQQVKMKSFQNRIILVETRDALAPDSGTREALEVDVAVAASFPASVSVPGSRAYSSCSAWTLFCWVTSSAAGHPDPSSRHPPPAAWGDGAAVQSQHGTLLPRRRGSPALERSPRPCGLVNQTVTH